MFAVFAHYCFYWNPLTEPLVIVSATWWFTYQILHISFSLLFFFHIFIPLIKGGVFIVKFRFLHLSSLVSCNQMLLITLFYHSALTSIEDLVSTVNVPSINIKIMLLYNLFHNSSATISHFRYKYCLFYYYMFIFLWFSPPECISAVSAWMFLLSSNVACSIIPHRL